MPTTPTNYLAPNLVLMRGWLKVSQQDVATAMGIKRSTYSGYETNAAEPSLHTLLCMVEYFNIGLDELIRHDLSQPATP